MLNRRGEGLARGSVAKKYGSPWCCHPPHAPRTCGINSSLCYTCLQLQIYGKLVFSMSYVVYAPHFQAVRQGIGVPLAELYAISEQYAECPRSGKSIRLFSGIRGTEILGYCVVSYYWSRVDEVMLIDIYKRHCPCSWSNADIQVFENIKRMYIKARREREQWQLRLGAD